MTDLLTSVDAGELVQAAFKHVNAREYDAARPLVNRALTLEPHTGTVAHVRAHLDTDSRATETGAAFLRQFLAAHDPFDGINIHNAWHLAALEFDLGNHDAALDWYVRVVGPSVAEYPMTLYSAASLLWRIRVAGGERSLPWGQLRDTALKVGKAAGVENLGCGIAFITTEDDASLGTLIDVLRGDDPTGIHTEVFVPVIHAFRAFWERDYAAAVMHFEPVAASFQRLSPFPEHRTPVEETYRAARAQL